MYHTTGTLNQKFIPQRRGTQRGADVPASLLPYPAKAGGAKDCRRSHHPCSCAPIESQAGNGFRRHRRNRHRRRPAHPGPWDAPATLLRLYVKTNSAKPHRRVRQSDEASKKNPARLTRAGLRRKCLAACYSPTGDSRSTLAAGALDFRVRNGNGYYLPAMATRRNCVPKSQ